MKFTRKQFAQLVPELPIQRGNVEVDNFTFLNALLYVAESGCKWRALPERFGKWSTVYRRYRRWTENGVLERVSEIIQNKRLADVDLCALSLDLRDDQDRANKVAQKKSGTSRKRKAEKYVFRRYDFTAEAALAESRIESEQIGDVEKLF